MTDKHSSKRKQSTPADTNTAPISGRVPTALRRAPRLGGQLERHHQRQLEEEQTPRAETVAVFHLDSNESAQKELLGGRHTKRISVKETFNERNSPLPGYSPRRSKHLPLDHAIPKSGELSTPPTSHPDDRPPQTRTSSKSSLSTNENKESAPDPTAGVQSPKPRSRSQSRNQYTELRKRLRVVIRLSAWMAEPRIRGLRLWDVCLPGSHNSASWSLSDDHRRKWSSVVFRFLKLYIHCQDSTIFQQLQLGIRFLDLRVCKNLQRKGEPFCAHGGFRTIPLKAVLQQIHEFLDSHPSEIVVVSIRRDVAFLSGPGSLGILESDFWVASCLKRWLGTELGEDVTIGELCDRRQNVIYFFEERERYLPPVMPDGDPDNPIPIESSPPTQQLPTPDQLPTPEQLPTPQQLPTPTQSPQPTRRRSVLATHLSPQVKELSKQGIVFRGLSAMSVDSQMSSIASPQSSDDDLDQTIDQTIDQETVQQAFRPTRQLTSWISQNVPKYWVNRLESMPESMFVELFGHPRDAPDPAIIQQKWMDWFGSPLTPDEQTCVTSSNLRRFSEGGPIPSEERTRVFVTSASVDNSRPINFRPTNSRPTNSRPTDSRPTDSPAVKAIQRPVKRRRSFPAVSRSVGLLSASVTSAVRHKLIKGSFIKSDSLPACMQSDRRKVHRQLGKALGVRHKEGIAAARGALNGVGRDTKEKEADQEMSRTGTDQEMSRAGTDQEMSRAGTDCSQHSNGIPLHRRKNSTNGKNRRRRYSVLVPGLADRPQIKEMSPEMASKFLALQKNESLDQISMELIQRRDTLNRAKTLQIENIDSVLQAMRTVEGWDKTTAEEDEGYASDRSGITALPAAKAMQNLLSQTPVEPEVNEMNEASTGGAGVEDAEFLSQNRYSDPDLLRLKTLNDSQEVEQEVEGGSQRGRRRSRSWDYTDHCSVSTDTRKRSVSFEADWIVPERGAGDKEMKKEEKEEEKERKPKRKGIEEIVGKKKSPTTQRRITIDENRGIPILQKASSVISNIPKNEKNYPIVSKELAAPLFQPQPTPDPATPLTPFLPGKSRIVKSWGSTCDPNPALLCKKLLNWTSSQGELIPRQPFVLKMLAGEVTPPSFDSPETSMEVVRFWTVQGASALVLRNGGLKSAATETHKLLLSSILNRSVTSRVNGVTHDFVSETVVSRLVKLNILAAVGPDELKKMKHHRRTNASQEE